MKNVSVIIPAYNASASIIDCLESVLKQSYSVKEIIIVDDGSTDDTYKKLEDYKKKHNLMNLYLERQSNQGPSVARNRGIMMATGEWIAFLDADDRWLLDKIALQMECLDCMPELSVIGGGQKENFWKKNIIRISFNRLLVKNYFITSAVLLKKTILPALPFDVGRRYSEDYKLWLELAYHYPCAILSKAIVIYANNENIFTRNSLTSHMWEMEKGELKNYKYCLEKGYINRLLYYCLVIYSLLKYSIRKFMCVMEKMK